MNYMDLVGIYKLFSRACRTNDVDLLIFAIRIQSSSQSTSRIMPGGWVQHLLNLMNMEEMHRGIRQVLVNEALSVQRSSSMFARNPVDMNLEQTINANATSRP